MRLTRYGPWAVVTGASDGIGRAIATELAARGVQVALCARRPERLEMLAAELSSEHGVEARAVALDLSSRDGVSALLDRTRALDVGLLVRAAAFGTSGCFLDGVLETELSMIDVNWRAIAALSHGFETRFLARGLI